jgi:hypothetical protein
MTASDPDCDTCATSGIYHVHFLMQHPWDKARGHPQSRWWPQWNRFVINPLDHVMEFGSMQLFPPSTTPDPLKFVAWSTTIPLSDPACHLLGPFDLFQPCLLASDRRSIVPTNLWDCLFSICQSRGIIPPALSPACHSLILAFSRLSQPTLLEPPPVSPSRTGSGVFPCLHGKLSPLEFCLFPASFFSGKGTCLMQYRTGITLKCNASTLGCHTDKIMTLAPISLQALIRKGDVTLIAVQASTTRN